jgi:hypothetical protein
LEELTKKYQKLEKNYEKLKKSTNFIPKEHHHQKDLKIANTSASQITAKRNTMVNIKPKPVIEMSAESAVKRVN